MGIRPSAVEMLAVTWSPDLAFWRGRRVLLTGHTGFKGAWLALWLSRMGARVTGFALDPPSMPSLYDLAAVAGDLEHDLRGDLRDYGQLANVYARTQPEIVLHLAAQSLVRPSYHDPLATFATNVMGTVHVLEAARTTVGVRAIVAVTTDKCYENREWLHPYRETDPLGGHDPYSASKAAAEIAAASWRAAFATDGAAQIATARAGNVIGAGDWAIGRLLPDCFRAFADGRPVRLRHPRSVRPWQHVLEPLAGYLLLAEALCGPNGVRHARAYNFGPELNGDATVDLIAELAADAWGPGAAIEADADAEPLHEAGLLRLDSTAARLALGWRPRWALPRAVRETALGYRAWARGEDLRRLVLAQIDAYCEGR